VALMHLCRIDGEFGVWIPDHKIGIATHGNSPLPIVKPCQARWTTAQPLGEPRHSIASRRCLRPDSRQAQLQRGDTSPGAEEIARFE